MTVPLDCRRLVAAYLDWLRARITVADVNGICEITTPFLDRHNDYLQVYVRSNNGKLELTDDGYTLRDLALSGCEVTTSNRQRILNTILSGFGVRQQDDELTIDASVQTFPQKKHALLQAMLAVNDMFMTASAHVASLFVEDVERYLHLHQIRFTPSVQFVGKSGFHHRFDFVIPASTHRPERLLRAINHPGRESVTTLLFAWSDSRDVRPADAMVYAMLNDSEKPPSEELTRALSEYSVTAVRWSRRDDYASELAA